MSRGTAKVLLVITWIVFFVMICAFAALQRKGLAFLAIAVWLIINLYLNSKLKCPHCGAWPRKGSFLNSYCPDCGEPLE